MTYGGTGEVVTRDRLERDVASSAGNRLARQVALLAGPNAPTPALPVPVQSTCRRDDPLARDRGSGEDWRCAVVLPNAAGPPQLVNFEVNARPDGCYAARGEAAALGPAVLHAVDGRTFTNPLLAFDGCLS